MYEHPLFCTHFGLFGELKLGHSQKRVEKEDLELPASLNVAHLRLSASSARVQERQPKQAANENRKESRMHLVLAWLCLFLSNRPSVRSFVGLIDSFIYMISSQSRECIANRH